MDPEIIALLVFAVIVLAVIWFFRGRIKIAIKGPAGLSLEVEAENASPSQAPNAAETKQTDDRSVAAGRDITHSTIITGDRATVADLVVNLGTSGADVVDRLSEITGACHDRRHTHRPAR